MAKRFYTAVRVEKDPSDEQFFNILLDDRVLKTPGKQSLRISNTHRADLVAGEWAAQEGEIDPMLMPCTRLVNVACEVTPTRLDDLYQEFVNYSQTDLLCFRADQPRDLVVRQHDEWQPILDWAQTDHGIELVCTNGLDAPQHPQTSTKICRTYATARSNEELTLLLHFTGSLGSAILGLAVMEKHICVEKAYDLSNLDEHFQNERFGVDEEAQARHETICAELMRLEKMI